MLEIYNGWGPSKYDINQLLKDAYRVGDFRLMSLKDVIRWKTERGKEKDRVHLEMIRDFLKENPEFENTVL